MKLLEILCEKFINSELFENAFHRQEVESRITYLTYSVVEHLIKVLKWEDKLNYDTHIRDINSWMFKIQSFILKGNKRPTQKDYYQWMVNDVVQNELNIELWIRGLHRYSHLPVLRTDKEVFDIIKIILYKTSLVLPLTNFRDITDYIK
jgi:hypothetical protein